MPYCMALVDYVLMLFFNHLVALDVSWMTIMPAGLLESHGPDNRCQVSVYSSLMLAVPQEDPTQLASDW